MTPELILAFGAGLIFLGLTMALATFGVLTRERRSVARSVAAIQALDNAPVEVKQELEAPFAERVLGPLGDRLVNTGRKLVRADTAQKLQYRLNIAGNPPGWDVNRIIGLKVLGMAVVGALAFLYFVSDKPFHQTLLFTAGGAALGYVLPNILLYNAGQKRETLMRNALPDALDLLTVSVEAGLGFDAAVGRVAKNTTGPLSQEFARLLQEMQIGMGRVEAMRAMAERTSLPDLKSFCLAMVQADSLGIPIGRVLRVQSAEMRAKRRQRAEEKAQQVPVRIMVPLVLFILPTLFIVILGPAGIQIVDAFSNT